MSRYVNNVIEQQQNMLN